MYPSVSAPARICGTAKMQKFCSSDSFPKLRPIVLSIGTFNHDLVRFLFDLLSPLVLYDYSNKDTFSFFLKLRMVIFQKNFLFPMMYYSFTTIPLQETDDIAIIFSIKILI